MIGILHIGFENRLVLLLIIIIKKGGMLTQLLNAVNLLLSIIAGSLANIHVSKF